MCRGPPPANPVELDPPSLNDTVSPSPRLTPQSSSWKVNYSSDPIFPESYGESAEIDVSQNPRPHASSMSMSQDQPSDADQNRSGSHSNHRNTLGGRHASKRDMSDLKSRARGSRQNNHVTSRMLLVQSFLTWCLT